MHIRFFFLVSILSLSVVPVINLIEKGLNRESIKDLYSTDVIVTQFNNVLVSQGISINPNQVIVGNERWFFLGDRYANTRTMTRKSGTDQDIVAASKEIGRAQAAWRLWMEKQGVKQYSILVGPNKSTVYPEYTPDWSKPLGKSVTDTLYEKDVEQVYFDVREKLKAAKADFRTHYRTDTHWNNYGAGVAHQAFLKRVATTNPELEILASENYLQTQTSEMLGGDLASFLKIRDNEKDIMVATGIEERKLEHFIYNFNTNELAYQGEAAVFGSMNDMYLINTPKALNDKKVLWLSDSFGTAQSQYMAGSFSRVLKVHWGKMIGKKVLRELVKSWKPDYVFVTVVEREAFSAAFKVFPPVITNTKIRPVIAKVDFKPIKLHQVVKSDSRYTVNGKDPFLIYDFKNTIKGREIPILTFSLDCLKPLTNIPVQVFWRTVKQDFIAANNIRFNAVQGTNQIQVPNWLNQQDMTGIRIDLDGEVGCTNFNQKDVILGDYL